MCVNGILYCLKENYAYTQLPQKLLVLNEVRNYVVDEDGLYHQELIFFCREMETAMSGVICSKLLKKYYNISER